LSDNDYYKPIRCTYLLEQHATLRRSSDRRHVPAKLQTQNVVQYMYIFITELTVSYSLKDSHIQAS